MNRFLLIPMLFFLTTIAHAQALYVKTFGDHKAEPIIFLHGGPGYNCAGFEGTTAQRLADNGFFVIVYDRRGEGRSMDANAKFNFQQTFDDIHDIYKSYSIKRSSLIGHSFGGMIATLFAKQYPTNVKNVFLVGAPISLQESFKNIIIRCKEIYSTKNDSVNLRYIHLLENMDTASIEYSTYCFGHAMQNGFYNTKNPSAEMKSIYSKFRNDTLAKLSSQMTVQAPTGFWKNERYTTIDLTGPIKELLDLKVGIFALYGKEDGLYAPPQIKKLENILGEKKIVYLDNCSHNVFTDQQTIFVEKLKEWSK